MVSEAYNRMKISVLTENTGGDCTGAEHGLSYLIDYDQVSILFDTGHSDLFLHNAAIMGLDPQSADYIILSHGHYDHGNGLPYLNGGRLICHPGCFTKRYRKGDNSYLGLNTSMEEAEKRFHLTTSTKPLFLTPKIIFTGQIPRVTPFEEGESSFVLEDGSPDMLPDDSALVLVTGDGLFIITGCGHSGIVNTIRYAMEIASTDRVLGIMGGFHLHHNDERTKLTIDYLVSNGVRHVLPSHCTRGGALEAFRKRFDSPVVKTGDQFRF